MGQEPVYLLSTQSVPGNNTGNGAPGRGVDDLRIKKFDILLDVEYPFGSSSFFVVVAPAFEGTISEFVGTGIHTDVKFVGKGVDVDPVDTQGSACSCGLILQIGGTGTV